MPTFYANWIRICVLRIRVGVFAFAIIAFANQMVGQSRLGSTAMLLTTKAKDAGLFAWNDTSRNLRENQDSSMGRLEEVRQNISLVTSFFADGILTLTNETTSTTEKAQHLHEITAAILKNIHNPFFAQVVVVLDGARDEVNCNHFLEYLENMEKEMLEWSHQHANITILRDANMHQKPGQKLTCVNREQGQPNYYDMFKYATNSNTTTQIVTSPIVILENADHVFDETLHWAGFIKPNAIITLPSNGYEKNITPPEVTAYFQFANRNLSEPINWDTLHEKIPSRCRCCRGSGWSWDGYIFHQDYVRGTLDPSAFQRLTNRNTTAFFNMNEIGAEDAALWALLKNLPNGTHFVHACSLIKTWHYHAAPKMHSNHMRRGFGWTPQLVSVPKPWRKPDFKKRSGKGALVVDPKTKSIVDKLTIS